MIRYLLIGLFIFNALLWSVVAALVMYFYTTSAASDLSRAL